jgi:small-conductance mechanosensitive channel
VITTLPEKIRRALPRNSQGKLTAAKEELNRLVDSQREIEKLGAAKINLLSSYQERMNDLAARFRSALEHGSVEETRVAFENWVGAKALWEAASDECGNLARAKASGFPLRVLLSKHPNAKKTLLTVCELTLTAARAEAERVTEEETQRLGSEWSPDEVQGSPVVRRANSKAAMLETIKNRIESEPIESTWNFAQQLLEA